MNILIYITLFIGLGLLEDWFKIVDKGTGKIYSEVHPIASVLLWCLFGVALYAAANLK